MKAKVIDLLTQARERELTAIGQYMAQHYWRTGMSAGWQGRRKKSQFRR